MNKLTKLRESKGWSQQKLADKSGVSQAYISELELGRKNPTVKILLKLSQALEVSVSKLLELDDTEPTQKEVV
ncbi:helix-turn-helix domain-containing protein [Clostridium sp. BJN0013]|uniref:helix-turn-helix domain-containing protein n=1 Tax=Clostridium sp. BJN0013 TaxID=3236840 RepID=UPI0034C6361D